MTAINVRADARALPLPDASVDLIVTSPPYYRLRDYRDGDGSLAGQIGSEATPDEYIAALVECTREWVRVLKPSGSMFVNLGDKYAGNNSAESSNTGCHPAQSNRGLKVRGTHGLAVPGIRGKSLLGLPWRYALACTGGGSQLANPRIVKALMRDYAAGRMTLPAAEAMIDYLAATPDAGLGLILRRDIIWSKPNGLPESVTDRCRSSHEYVFHLTKRPRYYAAVDEIRESYSDRVMDRQKYVGRQKPPPRKDRGDRRDGNPAAGIMGFGTGEANPLGKLPGSVWEIPDVRAVLDQVARRAITPEAAERILSGDPLATVWEIPSQPLIVPPGLGVDHFAAFPMELPRRIIAGWSPPGICTACGEGRRPVVVKGERFPVEDFAHRKRPTGKPIGPIDRGEHSQWLTGSVACASGQEWNRHKAQHPDTITGYACACPQPDAPTRPAIVADPFGGTGTTAIVADALGRTGISFDRSAAYCRLARWRAADPGQRALARQVPKPPPVADGQEALFSLGEAGQ